MKILRVAIVCFVTIGIAVTTFLVCSMSIKSKRADYVPVNPIEKKESRTHKSHNQNISTDLNTKQYHRILKGSKSQSLPIHTHQSFSIYHKHLYVTLNQGQTWLRVPENPGIVFPDLSDYFDQISKDNVYVSKNIISIVYGGRGPENISVLSTSNKGKLWHISAISQTASHNVSKGYKLYIEFSKGEKTGYLTAVNNSGDSLTFWSKHPGFQWVKAEKKDALHKKIMTIFGLQESRS